VQVDPMNPALKAPGTTRLNLQYDVLLSIFAFNFNLRRYTEELYQQGFISYPRTETDSFPAGAYTRPLFSST
jgi:hypothetical protein